VVGFVIGEVALEEMDVVVDGGDQAGPPGHQDQGADAAGGEAVGALTELVVDVGGGDHRGLAFGARGDAVQQPPLPSSQEFPVAAEHFAGAEEALDLYHATEYLADLARAGCDGDTATAVAWIERAQRALVADGLAGACQFVQEAKAELRDPAAVESAFPRVANYLSGHLDRMMYAARLRRGASVGSGMIEGAIKQLVGRRIKQTGARWKTAHIGPMVERISLGHTEDGDAYWSKAA
jgi:hypothetical protein